MDGTTASRPGQRAKRLGKTPRSGGRTAAGGLSHVRSLSHREYRTLAEFIHNECGIKLPPSKKSMLESRLMKRLRCLELPSFSAYCDYLFEGGGLEHELVHLLDTVTTNTTHFFREPKHFEILVQRLLPEFLTRHGRSRALQVWSAGCSTGEEPYTLAMVLADFAERNSDLRFEILATDISTRVLDHAGRGVYLEDKAGPVPAAFKRRYLMRSKDPSRSLVRVVPELRAMIRFARINFMQAYDLAQEMDLIFCRNVLIYFERPDQHHIVSGFCRHLRPGGHLIVGHCESLTGLDLPLTPVAPTVYRRV